jgi:hypothetical protein
MGKVIECGCEEPGAEGGRCAYDAVPDTLPDPCLSSPRGPDRDDAWSRVPPEERIICWQLL